MTYRIRTFLIAGMLAALAGVLTLVYVHGVKQHARSEQQLVAVAVAKRDISAGMTGQKAIATHLVALEKVARTSVVPGAISNPRQIATLVATQPTYAGEQVSARRFGPLVTQGVRSQLAGTFRAVEVAGTPNQLLASVLRAGDHVDVVANVKFPAEGSQKHFSRIVLRNLLVLRTSDGSSQTAKIGSPTNSSTWAMLRLTDGQLHKLFFVYTNEDWSLALRPGLDDSDSPSALSDAGTVLRAGIGASDARSLLAAENATQ